MVQPLLSCTLGYNVVQLSEKRSQVNVKLNVLVSYPAMAIFSEQFYFQTISPKNFRAGTPLISTSTSGAWIKFKVANSASFCITSSARIWSCRGLKWQEHCRLEWVCYVWHIIGIQKNKGKYWPRYSILLRTTPEYSNHHAKTRPHRINSVVKVLKKREPIFLKL